MNEYSPEVALTRHYQGQVKVYARILALVTSSRTALQNGNAADNSLSEVHELIQETHQRDQAMNSIRDAWMATGIHPGSQLAQVLREVEGLVRQLLDAVSEAEAIAKEAKARLLPHLDQEATARKMHLAYATASAYSNRP